MRDDRLDARRPRSRRLWNPVFAAALALSLLGGEWLWLARIGWMLLTILFVADLRFAFYALFFYAAWFHPTGFMESLPFTLKHFQLAFLIALTAQGVAGGFTKSSLLVLQKAKIFYYFFALLAIGMINYFRFDRPEQALRSPGNMLFVIAGLFYLFVLLDKFPGRKEKLIKRGLCFFISGVAIQVLIAFQNTVSGNLYLNMPLIHNNHMGILCAFSAFAGLGVFLSETNHNEKKLWGVVTLAIMAAAIASCSRTAWLSFIAGGIVFISIAYRKRHSLHISGLRKRHSFFMLALLSGMISLLSFWNPDISSRVCSLPQIFDPAYLRYTVNDCQNFGFLGIFRLLQLYSLNQILSAEPLIGVGFTRQIMDFHGFYFALLGATGLTGLLIFAVFVRRVLHDSLKNLTSPGEESLFFLRLGTTCAFIVWLFCSFLETYIVQFSTWIILWTVIALQTRRDE